MPLLPKATAYLQAAYLITHPPTEPGIPFCHDGTARILYADPAVRDAVPRVLEDMGLLGNYTPEIFVREGYPYGLDIYRLRYYGSREAWLVNPKIEVIQQEFNK